MPSISVIMSVYNEPVEWLVQSIDSIMTQTFRDFEFLIVNDNPQRTELKGIFNKYLSDSRIIILENTENIGLTKSLNKALRIAKGRYVARMDADDISHPLRFEKQFSYMERHPDVIVLGTNARYIGHKAIIYNLLGVSSDGDNNLKAKLIAGSCFFHPSVLIRKSTLDQHHIGYDEDYIHSQDYRLWEMMMPLGEFAKLKEKLIKYRLSRNQVTKTKSRIQQDLSIKISSRIQQKWLDSNGISYSESVLLTNPSSILQQMTSATIKKQPEYRMFVKYIYIHTPNNRRNLIFDGDFLYLPIYLTIQILISSFRNRIKL